MSEDVPSRNQYLDWRKIINTHAVEVDTVFPPHNLAKQLYKKIRIELLSIEMNSCHITYRQRIHTD
ncbi:MAG: hypothetical protein NUV86_03105 [Candidatus Scalindua sp.]|nr:hypothetical protein [Candidatus Scalindua sp.]MCR4343449.1 hypothetical protein [Candidatus Scalindua sp.]